MKKNYLLFLATSFITVTFLFSSPAFANDMNFSVEANIPSNQIDKSQTYFDLKMKPGQKQDISITIKNGSDAEASFSVIPRTAVTNQNGVIDYGKDLPKDSSLKYQFTDIVKGEMNYTLKPNETKKAVFHINMPKTSYKGIILGGFRIQKNQTENKSSEEGVQIKNQYAYVIGAKLSESEVNVTPKVELNDIKPVLQNYHTAISVNLQNTEPVIISKLEVEAKVTKKNKKEVLHQAKKENMSMAPNSNFDFPISWDDKELSAGKYHLSLIARDKKGNEWEFEKSFEIKEKETKKLNKEAVELKKIIQISM